MATQVTLSDDDMLILMQALRDRETTLRSVSSEFMRRGLRDDASRTSARCGEVQNLRDRLLTAMGAAL